MPNYIITILTIFGKDLQKFIKDIKGTQTIDFNQLYPLPEGVYWYDWQTQHWGVKWNAGSIGEWTIDNNMAYINYHTAWSPATNFYMHVSKQYDLTFKQEFADECQNFIGFNTIKNGKLIEEVDMVWHSPEAIALRQKLDMEEYDEDD